MLIRSSLSRPIFASLVLLGCAGAATRSPERPEAVSLASQTPATGAAPSPGAAIPAEPRGTTESPLAESARALEGSWRCSGAVYGPDGAPSPSEVRLDVRLELDSAWLRTDFAVLSGEHPYKFSSYRTFHASSGQWVNVILDNLRGHARSSSTDAVTWTGESSGPMGSMKIRDTETIASDGVVSLLGQYSFDGTGWRNGYDLSCQRAAAS